jgi:hypothetical protein
MLRERSGGRIAPGEIERVAASLRIEVGGKDLRKRMRQQARELLEGLASEIDEIAKNRLAFRAGHVYCYWCESATCEHSVPESPCDVFLGYHPTGRPRWSEFASLCLSRGDDRTAELFRSRPGVFAVVLGAEELKEEQLPAFGQSSRVYNLLGQVCAGHFLARARRGETPPRLALTAQFVECRTRSGGIGVEVNLIVGGPAPSGDLSLFTERDSEILGDLVRKARERLLAGIRRSGGSRAVRISDETVAPVLSWFARGIEHIYRQQGRRTKHAQQRAEDVRRPTQKALEEAMRVHPERLQMDDKNGTYIVLGARGRVHVYADDGLHVTSLSLQPDAIQRRIATGRWRPASREEWTRFREVLLAGRGEDEPPRGVPR